jgi:hypothetical protein
MVPTETGSNRSSRESKAYVRMALIQGALLAPHARALGEQSYLPMSVAGREEFPEHARVELEGCSRAVAPISA